ncbi:MAG: hypothetical protein JRC57_08310 [Deltaproteobacteria bacterium]|nr:hypothetical protein [Deltaproteobacteria bacterium]
MFPFAVLVIVGMVVIMIFCIVIDRMDANGNLEFITTMIMVKMDKGTNWCKTEDLQDNGQN